MRDPISVIVPAYNAQSTLTECLAALGMAMQPDDELLLYDDGSTDATNTIATSADATIIRNPGAPLGPAQGRNKAAAAAKHKRVIFVDADVILHRNAIDLLAAEMDSTDAGAAFGSYDDQPRSRRATSLYANLRHHFVHQSGRRDATTFWSGIGMIETRLFLDAGGYDQRQFAHPSIEDVELGMRLIAQGTRIRLVPEAQGTHWKDWSLWRVWHTDVVRRAIPWSRLIAAGEIATPDLNLARSERLLAVLALAIPLCLLLTPLFKWAAVAALFAAVLYIVGNRRFFGFLSRHLTVRQLVTATAMHWCYHIYASVTFATVMAMSRLGLHRSASPSTDRPKRTQAAGPTI